MDPDVCLENYRSALAEGDRCAAKEARGNLRDWLARGGFEPAWKSKRERNAIMRMGL
jgi:hypothetical protein